MIKRFCIAILSLLFYGCEQTITGWDLNGTCSNCYLVIDAPNLEIDENEIYQLNYSDGSLQTFTQLRAYVGYEMEFVEWTTNITFNGCTWNYCEDVPIVNGSSYSSEDGYSYQMLGVMEENIGDIATIWVGYYDNYGTQWLDSIKVKINE